MAKATTITKLELPAEDTYRLTKKQSLNGYSPFIVEGQSVKGTLTTNPIQINARCTVQGRSFRDLISTSWVQQIILTKDPNKVILHTENSIYELETIREDVKPKVQTRRHSNKRTRRSSRTSTTRD